MLKSISTYIASFLLLTLFSCGGDGGSETPDNPSGGGGEPSQIVPTNLALTVNIQGKDASNPYGDGSGVIQCSITATNAKSYSFRFGTGDTVENTTGSAEYTFTAVGTKDYTVTVLAYSSTGHSASVSESITIKVDSQEQLVWFDEFNTDGAPDSSKWTYDIGTGCPNLCGWGNEEKQYYTSRSANVEVADGKLIIKALKESYDGASYTSARLKSHGKYSFTYGRVEVRAKLPIGVGTWPAIWMLGDNINTAGWPACGEIDIMEHAGKDQNKIHHSIHTPSSYGGTVNTFSHQVSGVSDDFHIYEVNWTSEKIIFSVDGIERYTYFPETKNDNTWPFNKAQYLLLNIAMGGVFGGEIDSNFSASTMEVDYVRVYQTP